MTRITERVISLILPALKEKFLLALPSEEYVKTRIYFQGKLAEIESGTLGFYFVIKNQKDGKLLSSGVDETLSSALDHIFSSLGRGESAASEMHRAA